MTNQVKIRHEITLSLCMLSSCPRIKCSFMLLYNYVFEYARVFCLQIVLQIFIK